MERADLQGPLSEAVKTDNSELIKSLVKGGADIHAKFSDGSSYLHLAVACRCMKAVKTLVQLGIPVDVKCCTPVNPEFFPTCITPMQHAIKNDDITMMAFLKSIGADIYWEDSDCQTLLHEAAFHGANNAIDWLLKNGLEIEARGNSETPMHLAALKGHLHSVEKFLSLGVDVNADPCEGWTPLHRAAWSGCHNMVLFLINRGANVNAHNFNGDSPLHWAVENGSVECAELLIKQGAEVNATGVKGDTPLHWVSENGNFLVFLTLINHGAYIHQKDQALKTPLHLAVINNHYEIVKELLSRGASTIDQDVDGNTPINYAKNKKFHIFLSNFSQNSNECIFI